MSRYAIRFSKEGYIKYTSHLDMLRLFKRAFKKGDLKLRYSQGFNPHPKMSFAQPLSLGYQSVGEILEFETEDALLPEAVMQSLSAQLPPGVEILSCCSLPDEGKTLAALTKAAEYQICIPAEKIPEEMSAITEAFFKQPHIYVKKLQKKTGKILETDIANKIRSLSAQLNGSALVLNAVLDSGSDSNLSPEQLIPAYLEFAGVCMPREEIEVLRTRIIFSNNLQI